MSAPDGSCGIRIQDPGILEAWPLLTAPLVRTVDSQESKKEILFELYSIFRPTGWKAKWPIVMAFCLLVDASVGQSANNY